MAPPLLPPLSCVAGSLALSFTGAAQPVDRSAPDAPLSLDVPEPPPAAPSVPEPPPPVAAQPAPTAPPAPVVAVWPQAQPMPPALRPYLLRPSEKRRFFSLFVGGAKTLLGGYSSYYGGGGMDFKLEGAIGGHGKRRKSLAGAAVVQYRTGLPLSSFTLAPRLQWDKQIVPEHAIYFTTTATLGYRLSTYGNAGLLGLLYGYHGGMAAVGWGVSAIVADRLLLTFRPVNAELDFNGLTGLSINWDVFGGIGMVW